MKVVFESWRIQELPAPMHASRACREHTQMRLVLKLGQISFKSRHVLCSTAFIQPVAVGHSMNTS